MSSISFFIPAVRIRRMTSPKKTKKIITPKVAIIIYPPPGLSSLQFYKIMSYATVILFVSL